MSDNKTQPTPPPTPSQKTAAVPLKKETVRITLRARPGAGMTQPKELTSPVAPSVNTSPVPRPITTSVTPAGAATARVPTAPTPQVSMNKTSPVALVSKATAPIQLPSSPLPPPAARPSTAPVVLPTTAPQPASRTTAYVKLDSVPAPAGGARPPVAPRPPGAPTPPPAARPPGAPAAPRPPGAPPAPVAKAPGAPPRPGGAAPPMAATVPLAKAPGAPPRPPGAPPTGPKVEAGAPTVPLAKAPAPGAPPKPGGAGTAPIAKGGAAAGTQALPKATVQLAKGTQPMAKGAGAPLPAAPPSRRPAEEEEAYDEKDPEAGIAPLAIVCTLLAVALMAVNLLGSEKFFSTPAGSTSALTVPPLERPAWEQENPDAPGTYRGTYEQELQKIRKSYQ